MACPASLRGHVPCPPFKSRPLLTLLSFEPDPAPGLQTWISLLKKKKLHLCRAISNAFGRDGMELDLMAHQGAVRNGPKRRKQVRMPLFPRHPFWAVSSWKTTKDQGKNHLLWVAGHQKPTVRDSFPRCLQQRQGRAPMAGAEHQVAADGRGLRVGAVGGGGVSRPAPGGGTRGEVWRDGSEKERCGGKEAWLIWGAHVSLTPK